MIELIILFAILIISMLMAPRILPRTDDNDSQAIHAKVKKEKKY